MKSSDVLLIVVSLVLFVGVVTFSVIRSRNEKAMTDIWLWLNAHPVGHKLIAVFLILFAALSVLFGVLVLHTGRVGGWSLIVGAGALLVVVGFFIRAAVRRVTFPED